MRTEREIREKIEELMNKASEMPDTYDEKEFIYNQIDALLWVLGDESGKEI